MSKKGIERVTEELQDIFKYCCSKCHAWYNEVNCPHCYPVSKIMDKAHKESLVDHPKHYTYSAVEVIDAIEAWELPYHLGNVVKYVARHTHKGKPIQDLEKAKWYLERYIERLKK